MPCIFDEQRMLSSCLKDDDFGFPLTASFWTNPQFKIHIDEGDDDDDDGNQTIIVGVMQKDRRKMRNQGGDNHTIGYAIYGVSKTLHIF